jgi:hypothetical protein
LTPAGLDQVLTNHLASAASIDFFNAPTLTGRVRFVVIVLSHIRRRIVHFNVTEHPTAEWTAQQVVEASRTTPRPAGCIATATAPTARRSGVECTNAMLLAADVFKARPTAPV